MPVVTQYPTTDTAVSGGWTNPTNVQVDDGNVASINVASKNNTFDREQGGYGFDVAIPPAVITINSVTIEVEHRVTNTSNICFLENLAIANGVSGAVNSDALEPTVLTLRSYGYSRPGGGAWSRADLLDANFKTRIRARNGNNATSVNFEWDFIRVIVDYEQPLGSDPGPLTQGSISINVTQHYSGSYD